MSSALHKACEARDNRAAEATALRPLVVAADAKNREVLKNLFVLVAYQIKEAGSMRSYERLTNIVHLVGGKVGGGHHGRHTMKVSFTVSNLINACNDFDGNFFRLYCKRCMQ